MILQVELYPWQNPKLFAAQLASPVIPPRVDVENFIPVMEEIMHQLVDSVSMFFPTIYWGFRQYFFHQQYAFFKN